MEAADKRLVCQQQHRAGVAFHQQYAAEVAFVRELYAVPEHVSTAPLQL